MELQQETPGHSNSAFPRGELGTIDEIQLPEKVAKKEASCSGVSLLSQCFVIERREGITCSKHRQSSKILLVLRFNHTLADQ